MNKIILFGFVLILFSSFASAVDLVDSFTNGGSDMGFGEATSTQTVGSHYQPSKSFYLTRLGFSLKKVGSPTCDIKAQLWSVTGGHTPDALLAESSTSVAVSSLTTGYQWVDFDFPGYTMNSATTYFIGVGSDVTGCSGGNQPQIEYTTSQTGYYVTRGSTGDGWTDTISNGRTNFKSYEMVEPIFNLSAKDVYDDVTINTFNADFINESGTENKITTNGSILALYNDLTNITIKSTGYHNRFLYNINTSVNLNVSLYQHELYLPENGYELNDSESLGFQYNISSDTNITSCNLWVNESQVNTTSSISTGVNTLTYTFVDNGEYEWFIKCDNIESLTRRISVTNVSGPTIIGTSPVQNINVTEGDTKEFSVTVSSPLRYIVEWFKNGVSQAFGVIWEWIVGDDEQGDGKNVTAVVNDTFGQLVSYSWIVNVTNLNLAPTVSSIDTSESTIRPNVDYYVSCNLVDSDTDEDDLIVDIQWDDGTGWTNITEYYENSEWRGNISGGTHFQNDVLSYRCRGTDNETPALTSSWYYVNDYKTVGLEQTAPETPEILLPVSSERKYTIPVLCGGSYDGQSSTQDIFYEVYVRKNSTTWGLIRNASEILMYSYNIASDAINTTYDFRCRSFDGIERSDYITNINGTIKKDIPVFSIIQTMDNPTYIDGVVYNQGYFLDVSALGDDYSVYKVTGECNNDGLIDSVIEHGYSQMAKGVFNCINKPGTILHTIDAYIYKNNTNLKWAGICSNLGNADQYCRISKNYEVYINE